MDADSTASPACPPSSAPPARTQVNPLSLSAEDLARLLSAAGGKPISAEQIREDLEAGAPALPGGKVNLVQYAAWLVKQVQSEVP